MSLVDPERIRPILDEAEARELAVAASVDPRTIQKVLRGETVRGMSGKRALKALVEAGYKERIEIARMRRNKPVLKAVNR